MWLEPLCDRIDSAARQAVAGGLVIPLRSSPVPPVTHDARLATATEQLKRLVDGYAVGAVTLDEIAERRPRLEAIIEESQRALATVVPLVAATPPSSVEIEGIREQWWLLSASARREIALQLVTNIVVHPDQSVTFKSQWMQDVTYTNKEVKARQRSDKAAETGSVRDVLDRQPEQLAT